MTVTELDPKTALVVIDLQKGITGFPLAHPAADVIAKSAQLAADFRAAGLPVVWVNVAGGGKGRTESTATRPAPAPDWADLVPELDVQPTDVKVTKKGWGAFTTTDLHDQLQALGVTQIVLTGIATSIGVESTARSAFELGYNVALAVDAMTDMSLEAHEYSTGKIFPRLGQTGTTAEIMELLSK